MIKNVVADLDGTLIGPERKLDDKLVSSINNLRDSGIIFSINSGRSLSNILEITYPIYENSFKEKEALMYEDCGLYFPRLNKKIIHDGLSREKIEAVISELKKRDFFGMETLKDSLFEYRFALVQKDYNKGVKTDNELLGRTYELIKDSGLQDLFYDLKISKSNDGIDFTNYLADKKNTLKSYFKIARIKPSEVLVIGDSYNDIGMINFVLENNGKALYVGREEPVKKLAGKQGLTLLLNKGPKGTLDFLKNYKTDSSPLT